MKERAYDINDLKYDASNGLKETIQKAYELGQSKEVTELKEKYNKLLNDAKEAYAWFTVTNNRIGCMPDNELESVTRKYFNEIGNILEKYEHDHVIEE